MIKQQQLPEKPGEIRLHLWRWDIWFHPLKCFLDA